MAPGGAILRVRAQACPRAWACLSAKSPGSSFRVAAMHREILRQVEPDGYGARPGRAIVSRRRKLAIAARRGFVA